MSGFVGLNGELLTEMIYEGPVYYQEDVQRIRVTVKNKHGFLDEHARTVIPAITNMQKFSIVVLLKSS